MKTSKNKKRSGTRSEKHVQLQKRLLLLGGGILLLAFLVTAVIFFIPRDNTSFSYECWKLRWSVSSFLDDVADGDFADASESVYFLSEEGSPLVFSEDLCKIWAKRMADLRTGVRNNYLTDFSDLSVRKENGVMTVTVLLHIDLQGMEDKFYDGLPHTLTVVETEDGWKVSGITDEEVKTDFEKAISGVITASERGGGSL